MEPSGRNQSQPVANRASLGAGVAVDLGLRALVGRLDARIHGVSESERNIGHPISVSQEVGSCVSRTPAR